MASKRELRRERNEARAAAKGWFACYRRVRSDKDRVQSELESERDNAEYYHDIVVGFLEAFGLTENYEYDCGRCDKLAVDGDLLKADLESVVADLDPEHRPTDAEVRLGLA